LTVLETAVYYRNIETKLGIYMESRNSDGHLVRANSWLRRARLDFEGFKKVAGQEYLGGRKITPNDPALSVYLLQQVIEKAVKTLAVASNQFDEKDLRGEYSHHCLKLFIDFYVKALEISLVRQTLLTLGSGLRLPTVEQAQSTLLEIKERTRRPKEDLPLTTASWWYQFATSSPEVTQKILSAVGTARRFSTHELHRLVRKRARIQWSVVKEFSLNPSPRAFRALLGPTFHGPLPDESDLGPVLKVIDQLTQSSAGVRLDEFLQSAIAKEDPKSFQSPLVVDTDSLEKDFLSSWAVAALLILSALVFPHESSTRYPECPGPLNCGSYTSELGIVSNLREISRLTGMVLVDMESALESVAFAFRSRR
jgi:hypothetical protein